MVTINYKNTENTKNQDIVVLDSIDEIKYYENKIKYYETKCKTNVKHMYNLGVCYHNINNLEKAFECYEESAYLKFAPAQRAVGYCYIKGITVEKSIVNKNIGLQWYILSASQGYPEAINYLTKIDKFDYLNESTEYLENLKNLNNEYENVD